MKNYFYKINGKYIESFSKRVLDRFKKEDIRSNVSFLKSILNELNNLFKYFGGKISSKDNIPKPTDYPDSKQYNKLVSDINDDIQKIFTAQKLVEDDVNNLLNFNSNQRTKTFENLTSTQQKVYAVYIKNKKGINGEVIIPAGNPFESSDNKSPESDNIYIDQSRKTLTLDSKTETKKTADLDNVTVYFAGTKPTTNVYPNNQILGLGSHWKIPKRSNVHFFNTSNFSEVSEYKKLMADDPGNNLGVGWCEFETVSTKLDKTYEFVLKKSYKLTESYGQIATVLTPESNTRSEYVIKNYIGTKIFKDPQLIYLDINNSLQGQYSDSSYFAPIILYGEKPPQYKIVIPFKGDTPITNEIIIDFETDKNYYYPKIDWSSSKVFSNQNGSDLAYSLIPPVNPNFIPENGIYSCSFQGGFIKPSRLELIVEYGADPLHWYPIEFYMSHYMYTASQNYSLTTGVGSTVTLILGKSYDIFVDAEADVEKEKSRALNVLLARGKK